MTTATTDGSALLTPPTQNPLGGIDPQRLLKPDDMPPALGPGLPLQAIIMPTALVLIAAYFTIVSAGHAFLGPRNISNLAIELAGTAVLALGMLLVILPGHIDLSAGSAVGLFGGIAAV